MGLVNQEAPVPLSDDVGALRKRDMIFHQGLGYQENMYLGQNEGEDLRLARRVQHCYSRLVQPRREITM